MMSCRSCGSRGDLGDLPLSPPLGADQLVPERGAQEGPVLGLDLLLIGVAHAAVSAAQTKAYVWPEGATFPDDLAPPPQTLRRPRRRLRTLPVVSVPLRRFVMLLAKVRHVHDRIRGKSAARIQ